MTVKVIQRYETTFCIYTQYIQDGKEFWHCLFRADNHPVNRKHFRMSGAEPDVKTQAQD